MVHTHLEQDAVVVQAGRLYRGVSILDDRYPIESIPRKELQSRLEEALIQEAGFLEQEILGLLPAHMESGDHIDQS